MSYLQHLLPHRLISCIADFLANHQSPKLSQALIQYFIKRYPVCFQEAAEPDVSKYRSFNDFFTRRLKAEARPIDANPYTAISPADSAIAQMGQIEKNRLIQAKGQYFTLENLLAGDAASQTFENGSFITQYLAPHDYHRVHMPLDGQLKSMIYIPGRLFSVNPRITAVIPGIMARNERVVCIFETEAGLMAVIMVGAMIVGNMETIWAGRLPILNKRHIATTHYGAGSPPVFLNKGEEMGRFRLGSTTIVLFEKDRFNFAANLNWGLLIKMGQSLGTFSRS